MGFLNSLGGHPLAVVVFGIWVAGVAYLEVARPEVDRGLIEKISGTAAMMIMLLMRGSAAAAADAEVKKAALTAAEEAEKARKELHANTALTRDVKDAVDDLAGK